MFPFHAVILQRRYNEDRQRLKRRLMNRHIRDMSDPFDVPDATFVKLYRLSKDTAHYLIQTLHNEISGQRQHGIPSHIKVLATLHFLGHGGYQTTVGHGVYLGLSQPSVSKCLDEVTEAIIAVILPMAIVFPVTAMDKDIQKRRFQEIAGFPGVIGSIDCTHISIIRPKDTAETPARLFFNRKGFYSLNCQFVCNSKMEVIQFNAKFPGSTHDAAVWQGSNLSVALEESYIQGTTGEWLLGDSGYAQLPWLMTPYANVEDNTPEARYNIAHANTRVLIERCFGLMKARFRCLHKHRTLHYEPVKASKIIAAVATLHNLALQRNNPLPDELEIHEERHDPIAADQNAPFALAARRLREQIVRRYFI